MKNCTDIQWKYIKGIKGLAGSVPANQTKTVGTETNQTRG